MMTKEIRKFYIYEPTDGAHHVIKMHKGARVISCAMDGTDVAIWAIINPEHKLKERAFSVYTDGSNLKFWDRKTSTFVGTVIDKSGSMVASTWHIFEEHD